MFLCSLCMSFDTTSSVILPLSVTSCPVLASSSLPLTLDASMGFAGFTFTVVSPDRGTVYTTPELLNLMIMRSSQVDRRQLSCTINTTRFHSERDRERPYLHTSINMNVGHLRTQIPKPNLHFLHVASRVSLAYSKFSLPRCSGKCHIASVIQSNINTLSH